MRGIVKAEGVVKGQGKYKQSVSIAMLIILCLTFFSGCMGNNRGIEGSWVLVEEIEADGNKLTQQDLENMGISEEYVITGNEVKYTCVMPGFSKSINLTFELKDLGNNEYEFNVPGGFNFATVKLKGNKMSYSVGEAGDATTMVFKRK